MKVSRKDVVRALESCTPGLSTKGNLEQSNCFCFRDGFVYTYNDEILCQHDFPVPVTGAVPAKTLLDLLNRMTEDEVTITFTDNALRIKGEGRRRSEIKMVQDVILPIGMVEVPKDWTDVPPAFSDALMLVAESSDKEESDPLAYVHITPTLLEACDYRQALRYEVDTGIKTDAVVRGSSCLAIKGMGIAAAAETDNWVHWKTFAGLRVSVRRDSQDYQNLDEIFTTDRIGTAVIPGALIDALDRATPFMEKGAKEKLGIVDLKEGAIRVRAINQDGWYEEAVDAEYDGPPVRFSVSSKHVKNALKYGLPCDITATSLRIQGENFTYVLSVEENS